MKSKVDPLLIDVPMPIRTPRLLIKPREIGEGSIIYEAVTENLHHLKSWMPWADGPQSVENSETLCRESVSDFIERTDFTLSMYDPAGKDFIGSTGIHRPKWDIPSFMIGYWITEKHQGKGLVTEAVNALTRYCFEALGASRVYLTCDSKNIRSQAVMNRLGFLREGLMKNDSLDSGGQLRDTTISARYDAKALPDLQVHWPKNM